jgi:hypothetical protein
MAQKKTEAIPAGQTNLFDLLKGENTATVQTESPPRPAPEPVVSVWPADPILPNGWNEEDIRFLLNVLEDGPILVADTQFGIPTIHEDFGAEVVHFGFGVMKVEGPGFKVTFDDSSGMERTSSGKAGLA